MSNINNNKESITGGTTYFSQEFNDVNAELRSHFKMANREIDNVKEKTNQLVSIVHRDNIEWSIKKICNYIAAKNDDLAEFGFSSKTIYRYLNEENRQLIDLQKQRVKDSEYRPSSALEELRQRKGELIVHNNVMEQSGDMSPQRVIEESSISTTSEGDGIQELGEELGGEQEEPILIKESNNSDLIDETNPNQIQYLIQKYQTKISNAKHWISHYQNEVQTLQKEIARLENKLIGVKR